MFDKRKVKKQYEGYDFMRKKERAIVFAFIGLLVGSAGFLGNLVLGTYGAIMLAFLGAFIGYNWFNIRRSFR
ncbi:hypothetical protein HY989_02350 [Candidatus Micrarchaeota archaeon]|nr:hypothetical protein [Candidatus Micrarchaeota archaeon]